MTRLTLLASLLLSACCVDMPRSWTEGCAEVADRACERAAECGALDLRWGHHPFEDCRTTVERRCRAKHDDQAPDEFEWDSCELHLESLSCGSLLADTWDENRCFEDLR